MRLVGIVIVEEPWDIWWRNFGWDSEPGPDRTGYVGAEVEVRRDEPVKPRLPIGFRFERPEPELPPPPPPSPDWMLL